MTQGAAYFDGLLSGCECCRENISKQGLTCVSKLPKVAGMLNTLHFHSFAAKRAFVASQNIAAFEIISETAGSITLAAFLPASDFANNVFVFQVS